MISLFISATHATGQDAIFSQTNASLVASISSTKPSGSGDAEVPSQPLGQVATQDQAAIPSDKPNTAPQVASQVSIASAEGETITIRLPAHIPVNCVVNASQRYQVPELALLAIMRQESGGRTGVIGKNNNGSKDYGPAQVNDKTWAAYLQKNYGIGMDVLLNDMCQALMVQAYILRRAWNACLAKGNSDVWCGIANYHSPSPQHQRVYVAAVWSQYQRMIRRGEF